MIQERQPTIELRGKEPERLLHIVLWRPSPSVSAWHGRHWTVYRKIKKEWLTRIGLALRYNSVYFPKARITAYRFAIRKIHDAENAAAGLKPIVDSFVDLRLLKNDTQNEIPQAPTVEQEKVHNAVDERTVIIVEELK